MTRIIKVGEGHRHQRHVTHTSTVFAPPQCTIVPPRHLDDHQYQKVRGHHLHYPQDALVTIPFPHLLPNVCGEVQVGGAGEEIPHS